ncbi:MAG: alanine--tRNA ligase, partial [Acidimicrobiia bacterium]
MTAAELRRAFLGFFEERGHAVLPSSSLVPNDPTLLLTTAGMVQFKPYMLGEEPPPHPRATTVQKCFRTTDIDLVGTTTRHLTFFEMLGNFSLGDYFKDQAIPFAWQLVTDRLGLDPDRLWVTVFDTDDEAEDIWRGAVGVLPERIQRRGEEDNFWAMGPTGPCGPCSEIYFDRGPDLGPPGGPAEGGAERYVEIWNLVFMQYNRDSAGELSPLPKPNIDTGAGLERILAVLQQEQSVFETDVLRRVLAVAEQATGCRYGGDPRSDVSLRILAEHGRATAFLVADGILPGNEGRGYVLRRLIRRAVRHAVRLNPEQGSLLPLVAATVEVMGDAYPDLVRSRDHVAQVVGREEARFAETLRRGLDLLDELLHKGDLSGEEAFHLHDTLGFPIDVTREIALERGRSVDGAGFEVLMEEQRSRARGSRSRAGAAAGPSSAHRELVESVGPTEFVGYAADVASARVLALLVDGESVEMADTGATVEVVLDRTPFYAEAGGQVGDTGTLVAGSAAAQVADTVYGAPGLIVHRAKVTAGALRVGAEVEARIEAVRRERIRRNHTGTHLLH